MRISFENKVALVTGAAMGMGLATAKAFVETGAAVVLSDYNDEALRTATDQLKSAGHKVLGLHCDVANEAEAAMVAETVSTFGRLDAAFNNAGVSGAARGHCRRQQQKFRESDRNQSPRRVELHEARTASDARAGQRSYR